MAQDDKFSLYQRKNGVYYVRIWDENTKQYTAAKSTKKSNLQDATIEAARMVDAGEVKTRDKDPLFTDLLIEYWENRKGLKPRYKADMLRNLKTYALPFSEFDKLRMSKIKGHHINRFIDYLENKGRTPSVINRISLSIKTFLNWSLSRGIILKDITRQIEKKKEKKRRRGELTPSEVLSLSALIWPDHRMKAAVMLGCFAGLRMSEIRALRWRDVDFDTNYIYVRRAYTGVKDENGKP